MFEVGQNSSQKKLLNDYTFFCLTLWKCWHLKYFLWCYNIQIATLIFKKVNLLSYPQISLTIYFSLFYCDSVLLHSACYKYNKNDRRKIVSKNLSSAHHSAIPRLLQWCPWSPLRIKGEGKGIYSHILLLHCLSVLEWPRYFLSN